MSGTDATVSMTPSGRLPAQDGATADAAAPQIPDVHLEKELGRGGMGVVYRGRQITLDRPVAVKVLTLASGPEREVSAQRFLREARILAGLAHPHIVACYNAGSIAGGGHYLLMEFIDGPNLRQWIDAHGAVPARAAVRVVRDLAQGLAHAHAQGIIHRDVKPENVLLAAGTDAEFPFQAKLVDLGLARPAKLDASSPQLTVQGQIVGTPATMAPEQFENPDAVDHRADIYGLGCVLYHALVGQPAYTAPTIAQMMHAKMIGSAPDPGRLLPQLPAPVRDLVRDLLARDPVQRPQTYDEVVARCDACLSGQGRSRRMPLIIGVAVGAIAIGIVVAMRAANAPADQPISMPAAATAAAVAPRIAAPATQAARPLSGRTALFDFATADRFKGWTISDGGRWSAAEERDRAVSGLRGWISKPVAAAPFTLSARLHLANREGARTDTVNLGVILDDGSTVSLSIKNVGAVFYMNIETSEKPGAIFIRVKGPAVIEPSDDIAVSLKIESDRITATIDKSVLGPFEYRLNVQSVFAAVTNANSNAGPAEISDLTIAY